MSISKATGIQDKPSFSAIIPSTTGTIDSTTFKQTNTISSYETELSSKSNKECTKTDNLYSYLGAKPLVLIPMEASMMKMPGKRLILPKTISPKTNSMSLKNQSNNEISQGRVNSSKGKIILRTAYPESNTGKKILLTKPKFLVADAELKNLIPARNQKAYESPLANIFIESEIAKPVQDYCTNIYTEKNTDTIGKEYFIDTESHQGVDSQPGRQLLNLCPQKFNPFLSDSNTIECKEILNIESIELVQDIDSLNKVSRQEDSEIDEVIAEGLLPIASNNTEVKMDDSYIWGATWGADALFNDDMPGMQIVNPLTVEGKSFANEQMDSASATTSSTIENLPLHTPQLSDNENNATLVDMNEMFEEMDEEYVASILNEIENDVENSANKNDVTAVKDLLEMVIDDSIGMETVAQVLNEPYSTLNLQDIGSITESETTFCILPNTPEVNISDVEIAAVETAVPKRKGPGRPRKPRTGGKITKPRGRPARVHSNIENVTTDHHNYSNATNSRLSTTERRYRRMRDLNNVASQRCRLKRKEKMYGAFDELTQEEEKNKILSIKVRLLEEQVKALKQTFISRISNPAKVAPTTAKPISEWNSAQLERFVDDVANKHLAN